HYWSRRLINNEDNEEMKYVLPTIPFFSYKQNARNCSLMPLFSQRLVRLITKRKTKPAAESICKDSAARYQRLSLLWVILCVRS
ncbi:MAG: hypothetical protein NZ961_10470, partial [Candidatus Poribacteria bacterium]|nr:hypothetical protein [Candidatus Poribacteria bacterium]